MARRYQVISADSHLDINPDLWTHHVPAKFRDQAPRVVRLENGADAITIGDGRPSQVGFVIHIADVPRSELHKQVLTFETASGAGTPERRLREQDQDGVDAEILFSRVQMFRRAKDAEAFLALNRAYNEYLVEEYQAAAPNRLFPLGVIPTSGTDDAVRELEYCARAGFKGVLLDRFPSGKGFPTPDDDRFWSASIDLNMPISHHTNAGSTRMAAVNEPTFAYTKGVGGDGEEGSLGSDPMRHWYFRFCGDAACAPLQMAFAGVWDRFPKLQIYWAETMIGWLKYALRQIDDHYERYKYMAEDLYGIDELERQPSDYFKEHCLWGFLSDPTGVADRNAIGVDRLMWGSDFAHAASDWPHSREVIERDFVSVPGDERHLMLAGNAMRFFHLDDS